MNTNLVGVTWPTSPIHIGPFQHIPHSSILHHPNSNFRSRSIENLRMGGEVYSVWGLPSEEVSIRAKKVMEVLRSEFGGPQFEPHVTVVGAITLSPDDAVEKFRSACKGLKVYPAYGKGVSTGTFFYQCVYLLLDPTPQVVETSDHCCGHFGYNRDTPYMPHMSLLYADLTEEEKKKAQERANALDDTLGNLNFTITRMVLYKTDTEDKTLKSWEKVAEYDLETV